MLFKINYHFEKVPYENKQSQEYERVSHNVSNFQSIIFQAKQPANLWVFQQHQLQVKQNFENWLKWQQLIKISNINGNIFENYWNQLINEQLLQAILA